MFALNIFINGQRQKGTKSDEQQGPAIIKHWLDIFSSDIQVTKTTYERINDNVNFHQALQIKQKHAYRTKRMKTFTDHFPAILRLI